ncbi:MAG: BrnT family toxin [Defluviicoccus sp.]|nr:BrnT family toxin [Defluviicoccus sp.]MDE0279382.1 BrnT family toxin [Defluviicoccus sp.]
MEFEFDPEKSAANEAKHGIDFDDAQALWGDPWLLEAPARTEDEPRFIVIGRIENRHWSAVCTLRGQRTRIISVRRARKEEIDRYESA